jgi:GNAT superfamily N-acetyltransferase
MRIEVTAAPTPSDQEAVLQGLVAFNATRAGDTRPPIPFAALIRDGQGNTIGGAIGRSWYGWLYIDLLHLPESLRGRGLGRQVMQAAEAEARVRGCIGIWLDTFSFQAPGFYERLGFQRLGTLAGQPPGHARHWYAKRLEES